MGRHAWLEGFYHSLGTSLASGLPAVRALQLAPSGGDLDQQVEKIVAAVGRGKNLADAFAATNYFSPLDIEFIRAGEQGGKLAPVLLELAEHYSYQRRMVGRLSFAIFVPSLLAVLTIAAAHLKLWYFSGTVAFLKAIAWPIVGAAATLYGAYHVAAFAYRNSDMVAAFCYRLTLPFIGSPGAAYNRYRFYYLFYQLYDAGLLFPQIMRAIHGTLGNRVLKAEVQRMILPLDNGCALEAALAPVRFLPGNEKKRLVAAEIAGKTGDVARYLADQYREMLGQVLRRLPWAIAVAGYLLTLFLGVRYYLPLVTDVFNEYQKIFDAVGVP